MKSFDEVYAFSCAADGNGTHPHATCTATAEELRPFVESVIALPHGSRVVEIGTYAGRSASVYLQVAKELDFDLHFIDCICWNPKHAMHTFSDLVVDNFNDVPYTYHKMVTDRAILKWDLPIDFLYIDGEHISPWVENDYANWTPFIKSGGILAAHDSQLPEVSACLDRYARSTGWNLLCQIERMTIWSKP